VYSGHNCSCISHNAGIIPLVEWRKLDDSIVVAAISQWRRRLLLVSGLTVDISSTFCGVFMVQCVKLMLIIFEFGVLLFECFVYRQNVTCLKRCTRNGHADEVEDIIIGRLLLSLPRDAYA